MHRLKTCLKTFRIHTGSVLKLGANAFVWVKAMHS